MTESEYDMRKELYHMKKDSELRVRCSSELKEEFFIFSRLEGKTPSKMANELLYRYVLKMRKKYSNSDHLKIMSDVED